MICVSRAGVARSSLASRCAAAWFFSTSSYNVIDEFKKLHQNGKDSVSQASTIHPSAIVHPNAVIGQSVTIGPYCTIGPQVKIGNGCRLGPCSHIHGITELGDRCLLMAGVVMGDDLPGTTVIGSNNFFGHYSVIGVKCQDMKHQASDECFLSIGDDNDIREHVSIHRSSRASDRTVIGNKNLIMGYCHVAHDCIVGDNNILANNTLLGGHVTIEDFVHTSGGSGAHQFCHIGSYSFIGAGCVVSQDVPKYMMVSGNRGELRGLNLEGLRRYGFSATEVKSLRAAYRKIFLFGGDSHIPFEERLDKVESDEELGKVSSVSSLLQSIRNSFADNRRGICKFRNITPI